MPAPAAGERRTGEKPGAQPQPRLSTQWRRVQRLLDAGERRFVRGALRLQEARVEALTPLVRRTLQERQVPAEVPLLGELPDLVDRMARELLVDGIVHGDADVRAARHRASARGVELRGTDGRPVVPVEAIDFLQHRRDLTKYFDADQVANVRSILARALEEGATHAQTMDALKAALPGATRHRLEAIARTEATAAYNQGRIYRFLQSRGFIVAVQFMAVLDERTTDICRHRHGLVLRLDDPALRSNVPPLHYMCRSILSPIPAYELEEMGGQTLLERDRARLDAAPGPQVTKKGRFGNEPWPDASGRRRRGDGPGEGAPPMPRPEPVRPAPGTAAVELPAVVEPGPAPAPAVSTMPHRRVTVTVEPERAAAGKASGRGGGKRGGYGHGGGGRGGDWGDSGGGGRDRHGGGRGGSDHGDDAPVVPLAESSFVGQAMLLSTRELPTKVGPLRVDAGDVAHALPGHAPGKRGEYETEQRYLRVPWLAYAVELQLAGVQNYRGDDVLVWYARLRPTEYDSPEHFLVFAKPLDNGAKLNTWFATDDDRYVEKILRGLRPYEG